MSKIREFIHKHLSPVWLLCLLVLFAFFLLLLHFGFFREDLQTFLFPLALLIFWRLPRHQEFRLPWPLVLLALVFWGVSTTHIRADLAKVYNYGPLYISRLSKNDAGITARQFFFGLNRISKTYSLPRAKLLYRNFRTDKEAAKWLRENSSVGLVVRGGPYWLSVIFPESIDEFDEEDREKPKLAAWYKEELEKLGLSVVRDAIPIQVPGTDATLVLAGFPDRLSLPLHPMDLSEHWLSWLVSGLWPEWLTPNQASLRALRRDRFYEATQIHGQWKSHAPLGAAYYFLAMFDFLEAIHGKAFSKTFGDCSMREFKRAASLVQRKYDPEIAAAIFNNVAVLGVFRGPSAREERKIQRWLLAAAGMTSRSGEPVRAAKLALLNLISLERAGLAVP